MHSHPSLQMTSKYPLEEGGGFTPAEHLLHFDDKADQFALVMSTMCGVLGLLQGRMHLAWDYLHMVADSGSVSLLELRERIYNTGSADIPQDASPPVLPYQQEAVVPQAAPVPGVYVP